MTLRFALLLALLAGFALTACSTAENVADETADTTEDVADATADVTTDAADATAEVASDAADTTANVASDAWGAVTDAAGATWNAVTDLFDDDPETDAAALVRPTMAGDAEGTVRFMEMDDGLQIAVSLRGLSPGMHGFHIHQYAACEPADTDGDGEMEPAGASGGHWDPLGTNDHGAATEDLGDKHLGDLGNIEVGADGTVESTLMVENFPTSDYDVAQHAVVVHQGRDDLEQDPAGGGGTPVGCGVVEARM